MEVAVNLTEGSRLPTEAVLAQQLGVNRYALRRAIAALVKRGVLLAVPHVGCFVAPRRLKINVGADLPAIDTLLHSGIQIANTLVSQRKCAPPVPIAHRLGVAQRTVVIELVQRTTTNGSSFSQVTTWLPADRFDRIGKLIAASASGSLGAALAQMGVGRTRCKDVNVLTRQADPDEAKVLELRAKARVLVIDSLSVDASGEPTHLSRCIVDADRVELAIEL